ncbi:spermidine synthase [Shewanella maritima]|uniref:spermidine synthase n=1 Tax=Shewanella maritima TaxID=2520507 RepID=UPI0037356201
MSDFKVIHTTADEYGDFCVLDDGDYRILAFGENDEQSKLDKQYPHIPQHTYVQAMLAALLFVKPKSVIILGLGGGALVHAFKHYDAAIKMTAVEVRQQVIDVARRYFQLPVGKKLQLIHQDAYPFVVEAEHKKVDLLCADIYSEKGVDQRQLSDSFMQGCKSKLKQQGMLVLNCWKEHSRDLAFQQRLSQHFNYVYACLTAGGNWVIFACDHDAGFSQANNKAATQALSQQLDFNIQRVLTRFESWKYEA